MKVTHIFGGLVWFLASLAALAQEARLSNLSIRAQGGGADVLVTGFTIGPGADKTVLIRAVGPTLGVFGVTGTLADPKLELYRGTTKIAENDNFTASDVATFTSVGAFQLTPGSKDASLVVTLAPGGYTAQVTGVGGVRGVALVEVYEVGSSGTRLYNLSTRAQVGTGSNILIPGITISPGTASRRLLIRAVGPTLGAFGVAGTLADPKLELYRGTTKIAENDNWETAIGNASGTGPQLATTFGQAGAFILAAGSKDAALLTNLTPGNYTLQVSGVGGATGEALVEVYDLTESAAAEVKPNSNLYFAQLRPSANAPSSLAGGFAAISFAADGTATVNVNISNLSSAQTAAYLRLAGTNDYLLSLPTGQLAERPWVIGPIGIYSRNDIIKALNEGRIYVSLDTAKYPAGEVVGSLVTATGSSKFTPPAAAPPLDASVLSNLTDLDAARLLNQATFGATDEAIAEAKRLGVPGWIQAQMALPMTSLHALLRDDVTRFPNPFLNPDLTAFPAVDLVNHTFAWWKLVVTSPDQLRQRIAFALSEIFVVSDSDDERAEPKAQYHDILATGAFGNFRSLLEKVTLHPEMANYLTYMRNQKADAVKGTSPDENYAREIQQLFTVGLVQLQPDGTLLLDERGRPIPTYDNITITETAKVFTGWAYTNKKNDFFTDPSYESGSYWGPDRIPYFPPDNGRLQPLKNYDAYHDTTEKRIISLQQLSPRAAAPTIVPANQSGPADLKVLLDALFNHPNTAPFICKQLIKRLVTSNPSAGYVFRVASVFANNGRGVRGDLAAVATAILTDYEARSPEVIANVGYGKIREPLIRYINLMRVLKTSAPNGRFADGLFNDPRGGFYPPGSFAFPSNDRFGQAAYNSPSVFNFFSPEYSPPGPLADAGLVAPEMQIVDSSLALKVPNAFLEIIYKTPPVIATAPVPSPYFRNDFSSLLPLSGDSTALIDRLNLLFCGGGLTANTRQILQRHLAGIPVPLPISNYPGAKPQAFSGSASSGLAAPKVAAFDAGAKFTIEAWVFPTSISATNWSHIAGKRGDPSEVPGIYGLSNLILNPGGRVGFEVHDGTPNSSRGLQSTGPLVAGVWTHLALAYDGATIRLYFNGTQNAQSAATVVPPAAVNEPFSIGEGVRSDGNPGLGVFPGFISQARFWNVARTAAQLQQGMKEGVPAEKTGLVGNWLLDESTGRTAADTSGNGHHLSGRTATSAVNWVVANGQSLDRVQDALRLIVQSPDSALQK